MTVKQSSLPPAPTNGQPRTHTWLAALQSTLAGAGRVARLATGEAQDVAAYDTAGLVLIAGLCALTILALLRQGSLAVMRSPSLEAALTTAALLIALYAAYVALGEFVLYGRLSSFLLGLAFLVFAGGDLGFLPLLAGWAPHGAGIPLGWVLERLAGAALIGAAAFVATRDVPASRRRRLLASGLLLAVLFSALSALSAYAGLAKISQPAYAALHLVAGLLFLNASLLFWRAARISHRAWYFWLSLSLSIAAFAEVEYAVHRFAVGVVQPGDVLRLVFFAGILLALAAEWSQNYRRLRWQARELEALQALMTAPVIQDLPSVVRHIVQVVSETLDANARVLVLGPDDVSMRDPLTAQLVRLDSAGEETGYRQHLVVGFEEGARNQVALSVPLQTPDRHLGQLIITRTSSDEFSARDVRLLRAFGAQASVLLERSLLYEEVAAGAILQERSRLAREIHDGLAQHLAFLKMRVAWLQRSSDNSGVAQLKDIEGVLETALVEARAAITTLRARPHATSVGEAVAEYAEEFGQVSGLMVSVEREPHIPDVGPKSSVELLRVVQEALNNIRKHARATEAVVIIAGRDGGVEVTVRDNGAGFDTDQTLQGHFGLEIMRERAESLGGRLHVTSTPGCGTEVCVWVPRREGEELAPRQS